MRREWTPEDLIASWTRYGRPYAGQPGFVTVPEGGP